MAAGKFDNTLVFEGALIAARGDLTLAPNEEPLVLCIKLFQGDRLLAECDVRDHGDPFHGDHWEMHAEVKPGATAKRGAALGAATLVSQGPTPGEMNTYQWLTPLSLEAVSAKGA
jgi:hypothetical protein